MIRDHGKAPDKGGDSRKSRRAAGATAQIVQAESRSNFQVVEQESAVGKSNADQGLAGAARRGTRGAGCAGRNVVVPGDGVPGNDVGAIDA